MSYITADVLHDLGIEKSPEEEAALIQTFDQNLEERVGQSVHEVISDEQAAELDKLTSQNDQEAVTVWLQTNIPEYEDLIKVEFDILLGELAEYAEKSGHA